MINFMFLFCKSISSNLFNNKDFVYRYAQFLNRFILVLSFENRSSKFENVVGHPFTEQNLD